MLAVAAVGLAVALFAVLRPGDGTGQGNRTAAETTAGETRGATADEEETTDTGTATVPPPPPGAREIRLTIPAGGPTSVRRIDIELNERVVLVIRSAVADHAHLHGYDLLTYVAPGRTARITFRADVPGRFELELEDRGQQFAELRVRP